MEIEKEKTHKGTLMKSDQRTSDEAKAMTLANSVRGRLADQIGDMVTFDMDVEDCETVGPYVALLVSPTEKADLKRVSDAVSKERKGLQSTKSSFPVFILYL